MIARWKGMSPLLPKYMSDKEWQSVQEKANGKKKTA
jgi:hypothetical protein